MKKEKFLSLLSKKFSEELEDQEQDLLEQEIKANEEFKLLSLNLEGYLNKQKNQSPAKIQLEQVWKKIDAVGEKRFEGSYNYTSSERKFLTRYTWLKVAAILVLCFGFFTYRILNADVDQQFEESAAGNEKSFKMLDDGTKIWLNKKSTIRFNTAFGKLKREIKLEGEAYFDVARAKNVPLIIHARGIDIEVKGTAFNVNAYKENAEIQVALIRGEIQVSDRMHGKNQVLLKPNQKLTIPNVQFPQNQDGFKIISLSSAILQKDIKWAADTLLFRREKLNDLVVRMEKKYDLKIEIQSEQLRKKRFSGAFTNETIQQALAALKLSYPLTYTINNRLVIIKD